MNESIPDPGIRPALLTLAVQPPSSGERRRVLVVDDEPGMRYMARRVLERSFDVREAGSAKEALGILENEAFHIAIVDVRLPDVSGLDLLSTLKGCCPAIDVIVMTGSAADLDEALEGAIRRKAFFFLRKPFPMTVLETLTERVAETQELEERLVEYARALERNLESARTFQRRLLPRSSWSTPHMRIASHYTPSERLSGDFFDYWNLPGGGGTAILVADVMGHGPSSAMITGIVKSQVRSLAAESRDPGAVLSGLEEELRRIELPGFLTAFLAFDLPGEGKITWAGAGHPPALLCAVAAGIPAEAGGSGAAGGAGAPGGSGAPDGSGAAGGSGAVAPPTPVVPLISGGLPLNTGLPLRPRATESIARLPGYRLLFYTDGYTEAVSPSGHVFGETLEGAVPDPGAPTSPFGRAAADALRGDSPEAGIALLEARWREFVETGVSEDDRAAVLIWVV